MTEMCSTWWISFKSSDYDRQLMISFWRQKNQQRLKGWTWWQIKHGYNGNFDQRFICGCKHLIIVGVISFEVYKKKKKVNMKSVVSSVNIPVTVIVSQIGVLNARLGYFTISRMASAGHKYQLRFFNLTKSSLW